VAPEAVRSLRQVVHDIAVKEGLQGLFKGAMPSLLKAAPSAAVTFAAYDFFMHWLPLALSRQDSLHATAAADGSNSSSGSGSGSARRPLH
jgi:solute carrier family 25 thiamine pyrophosphate transporter 19